MPNIDITKLNKEIANKYTILNNTFVCMTKDDPKDRVEIEVGDVKQTNFYPQVKIKRWDNEVNLSYRLIDDEPGDAEVSTEGEKVKWKKQNKEVHFYETFTNNFQELKNFDLGMCKSEELGKILFVKDPYPLLIMNGQYWGADSPKEREIRKIAGESAFGDVLIVGLGLGVINDYLLINPRVTSVTIIEFSQDVIDIVNQNYPERMLGINLVKADYFEYVENTTAKFDYIYGDIFSQAGIQYFKKWERFLESSQTILKTNGIVDGRANDIYKTTKEEHFSKPAYEFEVILYERPKNDKVEFSLQTKGLEFYYQPPLNQEIEPKEGESVTENYHVTKEGQLLAYRTSDAVGSYAVYYKNHPINIEGEKVYGNGKMGHIYRPKIFDSSGRWVWGELYIDDKNQLLSVNIPSDFLDTAVYPIKHAAGLTFGYTTQGTSGSTNCNNVIVGSVFTGATGTATQLSFWQPVSDPTDGTVKGNIYVVSDLSQLTNGQTNELTPLAGGGAVNNLTFISNPTVTAIDYIICVWGTGGYKGSIFVAYDAGTTNQGKTQSLTYGTWPSPLVPTSNNNKYSIYVTYTPVFIISLGVNPDLPHIGPKIWEG